MLDRILVFIARHAGILPERLVRGVFLFAADIAWLLHAGGVKQLERNLAHVLGISSYRGHRSPKLALEERRRLRHVSHQAMRSYFTYFSEAMTVGGRSDECLTARVRGEGPGCERIIETTRVQDGSAPIAMGHQGNWDYAGYWAHHDVAPVTTVAERLGNKELLDTFVDIRRSLGISILLTGQHGLVARLEDALGEPHVLVPLLADRDLSRHGEFVHAFGSMIRVARGPATLAYDTGLPLYVVNMYRERLHGERRKKAGTAYGYVCRVSAPIDISRFAGLPREQAIHDISQAWVDVWASGIAEHPQDWHMLQPIFIEDLDLSRLKDVPDEVLKMIKQRKRGM
ncbi:phosphatidylinositol mannoside acyltransferase [Bifidobacterium thermophilum]|uniref:phosphatidylinositol mannoside acyltransferase n=1 Tax=Bifidobacterium thermophilum TaxID=33905 RepID=UPI0030961B57